jgi:putative ABC transport system ATP-binding protein
MDLLSGLNRERGITVLMVTHEPDMAAYAHRVVRFVDGQVEDGGRNPSPPHRGEGSVEAAGAAEPDGST